jgi:nitrite reductase/ring-hydroxylating ferredoxin subunit
VTSHDFWLAVLGPLAWKALHMLVYVAYVLILAHVAMGTLRTALSPVFALVVAAGAALVFGLHLAAARRERAGDELIASDAGGWVDVGAVDSVPEGRARTAMVDRERVALVRHRGRISCVSNVCRHQGGPLGEGRIKDGCLTCPWHGYQYRPDTGTSPPPYTEKLPTYRIKAVSHRLLVHRIPNAPGSPVTPVEVSATRAEGEDE